MPSIKIFSRLPQLDGSLCGCSLETGTKVVGYFDGVTSSVMFIYGFIEIFYSYAGFVSRFDSSSRAFDEPPTQIFINTQYFFTGLCSIYLLMGVYKNKPHYVKIWIVVAALIVCLELVYLFANIIIMMFGHFRIRFVIHLVSTVLKAYFFLVVYSYYRDLKPAQESIEETNDLEDGMRIT